MYSKIKIFGHPLHPILVAFPTAFYTSTVVSFLIYAFNLNRFCYEFGYVSNIIGVSTACIAAVPGFLDWAMGIPPESPANKRGLRHMVLNVIALTVFTINLLMNKMENPPQIFFAILLTGSGLLFTIIAAYIGGELRQKDHVGIDLSPEQEKLERKYREGV